MEREKALSPSPFGAGHLLPAMLKTLAFALSEKESLSCSHLAQDVHQFYSFYYELAFIPVGLLNHSGARYSNSIEDT